MRLTQRWPQQAQGGISGDTFKLATYRVLIRLRMAPNLAMAQAEAVSIVEEVRQIEELGDELLHIAAVHQATLPCARHAAEQPVRMVKPPALR